MTASSAALDACDWMVDYWRSLGQRLLPPELLN